MQRAAGRKRKPLKTQRFLKNPNGFRKNPTKPILSLRLILSLVKSGERAIFFSTHIISDIEKCATHVTYIHDGEIAESTSVDNMLDKYSYIKEDGKPTLEDIIVSLERTDYDDKIFD